MSKFINNTQDGFTVVAQSVTRDKNLSLKAMGLLVLLMSLPDGWNFSIAGIQAICRDGRDSVTAGLKELENAGYVKREQSHSRNGRFDSSDWRITNEPFCFEPLEDSPMVENPMTVNRQQVNKQEVSKQVVNTPYSPPEGDVAEEDEVENLITSSIAYLNKATGKTFRQRNEASRKMLRARFREGYSLTDVEKVIDTKARQWLDDPKMNKYLRPATLFSSKFEAYLQEGSKNAEDGFDAQSLPF